MEIQNFQIHCISQKIHLQQSLYRKTQSNYYKNEVVSIRLPVCGSMMQKLLLYKRLRFFK